MKNYIYPYGEQFNDFLEYQVNCPVCGEVIYFFIPENTKGVRMNMNFDTCHPFLKSISLPGAHKMIKIREDMMGGGSVYDLYNLYPIIKGESEKDRKERLVQIKLNDLKECMKNNPVKKEWLVRTLVEKNENILGSLEQLITIYEEKPQAEWNALDAKIENVKKTDSGTKLLMSFGQKTTYSSATVNPSTGFLGMQFNDAMNLKSAFDTTSSFVTPSTNKPSPGQWICPNCGNVNNGVFCTECGIKKEMN